VAVGGTSVGVEVGGTDVTVGTAVSVGGPWVGKAVAGTTVAVVTQPARKMENMANSNNLMGKTTFLIILFLLRPIDVDYRLLVP
jgi:hypothetical protein